MKGKGYKFSFFYADKVNYVQILNRELCVNEFRI